MNPLSFKYLYLEGLIGTYIVRFSGVANAARQTQKADMLSAKDKIKGEGILISAFMLLWFAASQVLPIIYAFSNSFSFAEVSRPMWLGIVGVVFFIIADWLLWRAHTDLGRNWSSTVQIKSEQTLVIQGIYSFIRHPIYTSHILWGIAQALILPNWLAGWGGLLFIIPVFLIRIPNEERVLTDQFGETYIAYMKKVGGILPKFNRA